MLQVCSCCNEELELNSKNFHRRPDAPSGFRKQCKSCSCKRAMKYYYQDHERAKQKGKEAKKREYYLNTEKLLANSARYRKTESAKKRAKEWAKEYYSKPEVKARKNTEWAKRKATKLQATPKWTNQGYISLFYKLAQIEAARIGSKVHVDHIIPLQSQTVCGLHCEDNLQLLTEKVNLQKGLSYNSDGTCTIY